MHSDTECVPPFDPGVVYMKRMILAAALATAALAPTAGTAQASRIGDELSAGDQTQRVLSHRYPKWNWIASCRAVSRTKFTCDVIGMRDSSMAQGRSYVVKQNSYTFKARITALNF
jgi:hypothetical protein